MEVQCDEPWKVSLARRDWKGRLLQAEGIAWTNSWSSGHATARWGFQARWRSLKPFTKDLEALMFGKWEAMEGSDNGRFGEYVSSFRRRKKWLGAVPRDQSPEVLATIFHLFNLSAPQQCGLEPVFPKNGCDHITTLPGLQSPATSPLRSRAALGISWECRGCPPGWPPAPPLFQAPGSFSLEDPHLSPHLWPPPHLPPTLASPQSPVSKACQTPSFEWMVSHPWEAAHSVRHLVPASLTRLLLILSVLPSILHLPHHVLCCLWLFLCWVPGICQILFMLLLKWL